MENVIDLTRSPRFGETTTAARHFIYVFAALLGTRARVTILFSDCIFDSVFEGRKLPLFDTVFWRKRNFLALGQLRVRSGKGSVYFEITSTLSLSQRHSRPSVAPENEANTPAAKVEAFGAFFSSISLSRRDCGGQEAAR